MLIIICILAYLLGSIPFGLLYGKLFVGQDIRKQGSGNIGATNAFRMGGSSLGLLTLLSDMAKGMVAIYLAEMAGVLQAKMYWVGLMAIVGHIFPVWLNFKGGKGVATMFSVVFMLGQFCAINLLVVWVGIFFQSRISSLASIVTALIFPILALVYDVWWPFSLLVSAMLLYSHRHNIQALLQGEEARIGT